MNTSILGDDGGRKDNSNRVSALAAFFPTSSTTEKLDDSSSDEENRCPDYVRFTLIDYVHDFFICPKLHWISCLFNLDYFQKKCLVP